MRSKASRCAASARGEDVTTVMPSASRSAASSDQFAVDLDHAGIAGLDRSKLGVIAHLRNSIRNG
jgi:hypothetical protein